MSILSVDKLGRALRDDAAGGETGRGGGTAVEMGDVLAGTVNLDARKRGGRVWVSRAIAAGDDVGVSNLELAGC